MTKDYAIFYQDRNTKKLYKTKISAKSITFAKILFKTQVRDNYDIVLVCPWNYSFHSM